jgi:hypothetical protein
MTAYYDRPCADHGLTSYRYRGRYGWIMIGATDHADALREAGRSTDDITPDKLEIWNGTQYIQVTL